jgi:hypothetical protein
MPQKRLLYLTANRLTAYSLSRGSLDTDAVFDADEAGVARFSTYISGSRALYYLVADVVEEDYHQDTIPYLGGKDRRQVLARKLAQRYRDTSLALNLSLGYERGERRDEKVLYASFSDTQQFQPWLTALEQNESRLVGVYSTALLAPAVARRVGLKSPRCLLVSVQQSGLRQSFVEGGKIRFSRVGRLDVQDPAGVAAICAGESARLHQYLGTMHMLPPGIALDIVILAPSRYHDALSRACRGNAMLHFQIVDADKQCRKVGLASFPANAPCEALFLHSAANDTPKEQFAQEPARHNYRLWQIRGGLYAAGTAIFVMSLLFAGMQLVDIYNLRQLTQVDHVRFNAINAEYTRVTATFPATPTSTENLKATMKQYRSLQAQSAYPDYLFAEISKALAGFPQIEIERIEWRVGKPLLAAGANTAPAKPAPPAAPGMEAETDPGYQMAVVSARLVGARRSDLRSISTVINQFVDVLKKTPQMEIVNLTLPFNIASETSLKGDIGSERAIDQEAVFTFTVGRKLGK